jgi:site-specific DNA recombinase
MKEVRYILYVRKSSEDAERQSLSIPAQIRKLKEQFPGLKIVKIFEESKSAFEIGRPYFNQMIDMIMKGEADGIIAWHPDRLSRNEMDAAAITYAVRRGYIKDLKFGSYIFNNTPDGIMMLQNTMSYSQYYSAKLSVDVKRGNEQQRKNGWLTYRPMPGYLNGRNPDLPEQGITVVDEDRYTLIRKMWDMLLTGAYSIPMIEKVATDDWKYLTPKRRRSGGTPIHRNTLYKMFTNIRYTGLIPIPGSADDYEIAKYPAMITMDEYDKAQIILGRKGKPRQAVKKDFAYRGFLFCKECGCQVTAQDKFKKLADGSVNKHIYYHCTHKRPCKNRKMVEEKNAAVQLYEILDSFTIHPLFEEWALEAIKGMNFTEAQERTAIENSQFKTLQQLRQQYDKLVDMASKELIKDDKFKEKSELLLAQIKEIEEDVSDTNNRAESFRRAMHKTIDVIAHGRERFDIGGLIEKRDVLLALGSTPTLYDGKIELTPFDWLIPIKEGLPELKAELDKVQPEEQRIGNPALEPIRTQWLGCKHSPRH